MRLQGAGIGALGDVMAGTPGEAAPVDARAIGQLICAGRTFIADGKPICAYLAKVFGVPLPH